MDFWGRIRPLAGRPQCMNRDEVIALREHDPELRAAGLEHLFLHGYARGTPIRELSDVEVIADFDQAKRLSLLGRVHLEAGSRISRASRRTCGSQPFGCLNKCNCTL